LGVLIYQLIRRGAIEETKLRLKTEIPERRHYRSTLNFLTSYGLLQEIGGLSHESAFTLMGRRESSREEIICRVDPFAYLSHMSAMEHYGLTDRIPQTTFISSPSPRDWSAFARKKMQADLSEENRDYIESGFPSLRRIKLTRLRGREVHVVYRMHLGAFRHERDPEIRVSTIGRTFLDMIKDPDFCGGIRHVLSVYEESAERYLKLIVDDVNSSGAPIDKVRAGYVLSKVCGLEDPTIDNWKRFVQRGGSRKLYGKGEYSSEFSEDWCLSLNLS